MPDNQVCMHHRRLEELQEAVIRLTVIAESHEKELIDSRRDQKELLKQLAADKEENTKFKAKVGGIVLATTTIVSMAWVILIAALSFYKH